MMTINKIKVYVLDFLQKQMLLTAFLLIALLAIAYFKPEASKPLLNSTSITIAVVEGNLTTMPRFFLNH
jgi:hypothetical protein